MAAPSSPEWNELILKESGSFLQSWEWGALQEKIGRRIERARGNSFESLLVKCSLPFHKSYWYAPHGPVFSRFTEDSLLAFVEKIKRLGDHESIFIRIEPRALLSDGAVKLLRSSGFIKSKEVQPSSTRYIDLKKSEKDLMKYMDHDTRYAIRLAERKGIKIFRYTTRVDKENIFPIFWKLFMETNDRHRLKLYSKNYYEECARLEGECASEIYIAYLGNEPVASALIVVFGDMMSYLFAGSDKKFSKYNGPTALLWNIIQTGKKENKKLFDLWGISEKNKNWKGVTAFKKSFGGTEAHYIGTWDYVLDWKWYVAYRVMKSLR